MIGNALALAEELCCFPPAVTMLMSFTHPAVKVPGAVADCQASLPGPVKQPEAAYPRRRPTGSMPA